MAVITSRSLMMLLGGLVMMTQSHYYHHHHHPTGYNRASRGHTWSYSPSLPATTRSFSQSPRKSIFKSSRGRLSVAGSVFPSYAERCGDCAGEASKEVCGSDGKTYRNSCELERISCKKYWDLRVVSQGPCRQDCPGIDLGMYTGWGLSRASNNGYCHHDFFRCCRAARSSGLGDEAVRSCCQARADKCFAFVAEKPWRSGVKKYGK